MGVAAADVPDASQQVFIVLHRKLHLFDASSSLRTFIYGIALRIASDYRRRTRRHREDLVESIPEEPSAPTQLATLARKQAFERLERALDELPAEQREVFVLYEIEELAMADVANTVGCQLFTAYSRLRAARKAIAEYFDEPWLVEAGSETVSIGRKTP